MIIEFYKSIKYIIDLKIAFSNEFEIFYCAILFICVLQAV